MPTNVSFDLGTAPYVWADTTDYSSTVSGMTRTDQIDLTSLASAAAREGDKKDLGVVRPRKWMVTVAIEMAVAPTSGETIDIWWAGSPSATAGNANPGETSGADAAYTGSTGDSLLDSLPQLQYVGSIILTADATTLVQYATVGVLEDVHRYGFPVVYNASSQALVADAVEMYVALMPMQDEIQD